MNFTLLSKLRSYVQVSICISAQSHTPEANSCCAWSDATPSTRSTGHRVGNGGTKAMGGKRGRWEWGCESRAVGELSRSAAGYCMQHMQESLPECPQREPFQTVLSPYDTKGGWELGGGLRFPSVLRWTANFPHSSQPPQHPQAHGAQLLQLRAPKPTCKELCHQGCGCTGFTALLISIPQQQNRAAVQLVGQPDAEKPLQGPEIPAQAPLQGSV